MILETIVTLAVGLGLSIQICFSKRFMLRRDGSMVEVERVMPRMSVEWRFVNR
jgi:hypothetical protein